MEENFANHVSDRDLYQKYVRNPYNNKNSNNQIIKC